MDDEKYEAIIAKQLERENNIKELKKDYIDDIENPKKQITVKIFPNTHKKLKVIAASKDTSLEKIATAIVEDKVEEFVENISSKDDTQEENNQEENPLLAKVGSHFPSENKED